MDKPASLLPLLSQRHAYDNEDMSSIPLHTVHQKNARAGVHIETLNGYW